MVSAVFIALTIALSLTGMANANSHFQYTAGRQITLASNGTNFPTPMSVGKINNVSANISYGGEVVCSDVSTPKGGPEVMAALYIDKT